MPPSKSECLYGTAEHIGTCYIGAITATEKEAWNLMRPFVNKKNIGSVFLRSIIRRKTPTEIKNDIKSQPYCFAIIKDEDISRSPSELVEKYKTGPFLSHKLVLTKDQEQISQNRGDTNGYNVRGLLASGHVLVGQMWFEPPQELGSILLPGTSRLSPAWITIGEVSFCFLTCPTYPPLRNPLKTVDKLCQKGIEHLENNRKESQPETDAATATKKRSGARGKDGQHRRELL